MEDTELAGGLKADYSWTTDNDTEFSHVRLIDFGSSGEVHEVYPLSSLDLTI